MNMYYGYLLKLLCNISSRTVYLIIFSVLSITAAYSGWREDIGVFRIGIVSAKANNIAVREIEPFREALQQAINMPVKVFVSKTYRGLIDAQAKKRVQYAVHSATSYASTWLNCKCVNPLAAAKLSNGSVSYRSILVVKKDRIANLNELKGKRIAVSSKSSLSGYLIPEYELNNKQLRFTDLPNEPDDTVLVVAGSVAGSLDLFQNDLVDGLLGWSTLSGLANTGYSAGILADLVNRNGLSMDELRIAWSSEPIFNGPHAIDSEAPEALQSAIREFLINLYEKNPRAYDSAENFRGGGFAKVEQADYLYLIEYLDKREALENSGESK